MFFFIYLFGFTGNKRGRENIVLTELDAALCCIKEFKKEMYR